MKLNITKEKFREMYLNKTNKEICDELGISYFILVKFANQLGLKKRAGRPFKRYEFEKEEEIELIE